MFGYDFGNRDDKIIKKHHFKLRLINKNNLYTHTGHTPSFQLTGKLFSRMRVDEPRDLVQHGNLY